RCDESDHLVDEPGVDPDPAQDRHQPVDVEAPGEHVGVEGIDEGIRLPVVAEEQLARPGGGVDAAAEQLHELEPDVLAQVPELPALQMRELVLEHDAVVRDAVEHELLANGLADLRRARGNEVDERSAAVADRLLLDRLDQLGDAGHVHLVLGALEGRPQQLAERVELTLQIGLVEVPATDERSRRARDAEPAHRRDATASTSFSTTLPRRPSQTITSAPLRARSLPSTLPTKLSAGIRRSRRCAATSVSPPFDASTPMLSSATRGLGTLEMRRAYALPMRANCTSSSASQRMVAPTSSTRASGS